MNMSSEHGYHQIKFVCSMDYAPVGIVFFVLIKPDRIRTEDGCIMLEQKASISRSYKKA